MNTSAHPHILSPDPTACEHKHSPSTTEGQLRAYCSHMPKTDARCRVTKSGRAATAALRPQRASWATVHLLRLCFHSLAVAVRFSWVRCSSDGIRTQMPDVATGRVRVEGERRRERYQTGNAAPRILDAVAIAVQDSSLPATMATRRLGRPCRHGGRMIPKSTSAPTDRNRPRVGHQASQLRTRLPRLSRHVVDRPDQVNRPLGGRCTDHLGGGHSGKDDLVMPVAAVVLLRDCEVRDG
ncbi:hypothetical protein B0T18DRAFT_211185 [Schizothecium vesticola]|uniref:Uncharacterized protein n=1 Tax=Schizothecium vesticola TaxID=314040 RepID=A0AA40JZ73_9PEZI|nr:hypothetical protein B0T18DRAFT_211185 [Schizothecium vesticola]